jgi:hypothetical protein
MSQTKSSKSSKYLVEGDINFFDELNKPEADKIMSSTPVPVCLITDEPLTDLSVNLSCGHSFNYVPLYKEVCLQKTGKNYLEISKLSANELKCPYCRKIQRGLLTFHESLEMICPKVYGVNASTPSAAKPAPAAKQPPAKPSPAMMAMAHAAYITACPQLLKTGANKGMPCGKNAYLHDNTAGLCVRHYNLSLKVVNPVPTTVVP